MPYGHRTVPRTKVRKKSTSSRGGHPSQGRPTVGGATGGGKPTRYTSPTGTQTYQGIPSPAAAKQIGSQKKLTKVTKKGRHPDHRMRENRQMVKVIEREAAKTERRAAERRRRQAISDFILPEPVRDLSPGKTRKSWEKDLNEQQDKDSFLGSEKLGFLEKEAEGRGALAKGAKFLGETADKLSKGQKSMQTGFRSKRPARRGGPLGIAQAGASPVGLTTRSKEAMDLTANLPSSLYLTAAAGKEAIEGRPERAKGLFKDWKETSAIHSALSGQWKEAAKRASERPLTTGLELWGAKGAVGRTGGAVARRVPLPKGKARAKVRQAGSTKGRGTLELYPEGQRTPNTPKIERRYSKDILTKGAQVYADRRKAQGRKTVKVKGRTVVPGRTPRDPNYDPGRPIAPSLPRRAGGAATAGRPIRPRINRLIDTRVFSHERARRHRKEQVAKDVSKITPVRRATRWATGNRKGRVKANEGGGVQAILEGVARVDSPASIRAGIKKRRLELAKEAPRLKTEDPVGYKQNVAERKSLRETEALPDERLLDLVDASGALGKGFARQQSAGRRVGAWDENAQSKRFFPALQTHQRRTRGEERRGYTDEEVNVATKVLQRRVRRGQAVPERLAGQQWFHGTDAKTGNAINFAHGFGSRRRDTAWVGTKPVADSYGDTTIRVRAHPKRTIRADDDIVMELTNQGLSAVERNARLRALGYDSLLVPGRGLLALDKGIVKAGKLTKAEVAHGLKGRGRRVAVPARRLDEAELNAAAKVLQRRERRGRSTLQGTLPGGPSLVTQRPVTLTATGADTSAYQGNFPAPRAPGGQRSGKAYERGTRETGSDAIMRQAIAAETHISANEGFQLLDREFGVPASLTPGQRYAPTKGESLVRAQQLTHDPETGLLRPGEQPLVPVNMAEFRTFGSRLRRKQEEGSPSNSRSADEAAEIRALGETWDAAVGESGRGKWILMPEDVVFRLREHAKVTPHGPIHGLTNLFKDVVLTTSSPARWIGGNITDVGMRTAFAGITPLDIIRGRRVVRGAAQKGLQGEQAASAVSGGGLYHASEALSRSFRPSAVGETAARTVGAAPWRAWKGGVYAIEHFIEELPQWGTVGKAMREDTGRSVPGQPHRTKSAELAAAEAELKQLSPTGDLVDIRRSIPGQRAQRMTDEKLREATEKAAKAEQQWYHVAEGLPKGKDADLGATMEVATMAQRTRWEHDVYVAEARRRRALKQPDAVRKQDGEMKRSLKTLIKLHDKQIDNFATRLATDRAVEGRIQALTEDVIGRWGKVSPTMRRALIVAPFAQWLGAATRYTYVTLPSKHPIKTGILAGITEMTEEERRKLGLSYFLPRDKQVQDYQMGTLPLYVGKNKYGPVVSGIRTARMTSLGTAAGTPGNLGEFLFPQFAGALDAWAGTSFTHEHLVYPEWWPEKNLRGLPLPPDMTQKVGLGALIESMVPFASAFRRSVLDKGRAAEPYSTILSPAQRKKWDEEHEQYVANKGTILGGVLEWLTPFAPNSKLYTYGAGKSITESRIANEKLDEWSRLPKKAEGRGFGGGDSTSGGESTYGFGGGRERFDSGKVKPGQKPRDKYGF
jgi:hypothetical protein